MKTNEEKIKEAEALVEKVKELLKERDDEQFVLKYEEYDEDEDEDFDEDDDESSNKYDVFVEEGDEENYVIFYGQGWSINDEIYLRKLYLDDDALMLGLLNRPYYVWPGEVYEWKSLDDDFYSGDIVSRLGTIEQLDNFIAAFKNIIKLMEDN